MKTRLPDIVAGSPYLTKLHNLHLSANISHVKMRGGWDKFG